MKRQVVVPDPRHPRGFRTEYKDHGPGRQRNTRLLPIVTMTTTVGANVQLGTHSGGQVAKARMAA